MTALRQYQRLESTGLWRESATAQRREVWVSFGNASLVIADRNETPLAHWSLPAVERLNGAALPALYGPNAEGTETLEIAEPDMIDAIERVRAAILRRRPRRGRVRLAAGALVLAALSALAVFWLPDALVRQTAAVVPAAKRQQIGHALMAEIAALAGRPCAAPQAALPLERLTRRLLPGGGEIAVLPAGLEGARALPGGIVVLGQGLIAGAEGPEVAAGHVLAEAARAAAEDPLARLLRQQGPVATFRLLTTGEMTPSALGAHAAALLAQVPEPVAGAALLELFAAREVASTPYAYARDPSGETTLALIEADPFRGRPAPRLLSDADWLSLQGICD
jgi:hypothetical protein